MVFQLFPDVAAYDHAQFAGLYLAYCTSMIALTSVVYSVVPLVSHWHLSYGAFDRTEHNSGR